MTDVVCCFSRFGYLWWFHYHGPVVTVDSELNPMFLPIGVCGVIVNFMHGHRPSPR